MKEKRSNKNIIQKIGIIVIVVGLIIVCLPLISRTVIGNEVQMSINEFERIANEDSIKDKNDLQNLYKEFDEYNKSLYKNGQALTDAFSYEEEVFDLSKYGFIKNISGVINIPKINVNLPIYLGATKENLSQGAVCLSNTSVPIGGKNTNCVIAAHNGYRGADMFKNLYNLNINDEVYIKNLWEELKYTVYDMQIIEPTDMSNILIKPEQDMLTLVTCYPLYSNAKRYIVFCKRS